MSKFASDIIISNGSQLMIKSLGFISTILIANMIGISQLGIWTQAGAIFGLAVIFINSGGGANLLLMREIASDHNLIKKYYLHVYVNKAVIVIALIIPVFLIIHNHNFSNEKAYIFYLVFILTLLDVFLLINYNTFYGANRVTLSIALQSTLSIINFLIVIALYYTTRNIYHLLLCKIGFALFGIGLAYLLYRKSFFKSPKYPFSYRFCFSLIKKSMPFLALSITAQLAIQSDLICLSFLVKEENIGLYKAATNISLPFDVLSSSTMAVFLPTITYTLYQTKDINKFVTLGKQMLRFVLFVSVLIALTISTLSEIIITNLYTSEYHESFNVLRWIVINLVFSFTSAFFGNILLALKKEKMIVLFALVASIINITLNIIFIRLFDIYGAIIATLFSTFLISFMQGFAVIKVYKVRLEILSTLKSLTLPLIFSIITLFVCLNYLHFNIIGCYFLSVFTFVLLLWFTKYFSFIQFSTFSNLFK